LFLLLSLIDAGARWRQPVSMCDNKRKKNLHYTPLACITGFNITGIRNDLPVIASWGMLWNPMYYPYIVQTFKQWAIITFVLVKRFVSSSQTVGQSLFVLMLTVYSEPQQYLEPWSTDSCILFRRTARNLSRAYSLRKILLCFYGSNAKS